MAGKLYERWISYFGTPEVIHTDRGTDKEKRDRGLMKQLIREREENREEKSLLLTGQYL